MGKDGGAARKRGDQRAARGSDRQAEDGGPGVLRGGGSLLRIAPAGPRLSGYVGATPRVSGMTKCVLGCLRAVAAGAPEKDSGRCGAAGAGRRDPARAAQDEAARAAAEAAL